MCKIDTSLVKREHRTACDIYVMLLVIVGDGGTAKQTILVPVGPVAVGVLHSAGIEVAQDRGSSCLYQVQ